MKRILSINPTRDESKLKDVGRLLTEGLPGYESTDRYLRMEWGAKLLGYSNRHEFHRQSQCSSLPKPGSITRLQIQAVVACQLVKLTGIDLLEAVKRAKAGRLHLLSIDQLTLEYKSEVNFRLNANDESPWALGRLGAIQRQLHVNHWEAAKLIEAGAPAFTLALNSSGLLFQWDLLIAFVEAHHAAQNFPELKRYHLSKLGDQEGYFRQVLVPNAHTPLPDYFAKGGRLPDHQVVWLFDEDGNYIARTLQHVAHGGLLDVLCCTDEDIHQLMSEVLAGTHRGRMGMKPISSDCDQIRSRQAVFMLGPGAHPPGKISDIFEVPTVPVDHLIKVLGVTGQCQRQHLDGKSRDVWLLKGDPISDGGLTYRETKSWLTKRDLPRLFPDLPPETEASIGRPVEKALPTHVHDLQWEFATALQQQILYYSHTLDKHFESGALQTSLMALSAVDLESFASRDFALATADLEEDPRQQEIAVLSAKHRARSIAGQAAASYPWLSNYGPLTVYMAISKLHGGGDFDWDAPVFPAQEIMTHVFLIAARAHARVMEFHVDPALLHAVTAMWVEAKVALDDAAQAMLDFTRYQRMLRDQSDRIEQVSGAVAEAVDRQRKAKDGGFAFIAEAISVTREQSPALGMIKRND